MIVIVLNDYWFRVCIVLSVSGFCVVMLVGIGFIEMMECGSVVFGCRVVDGDGFVFGGRGFKVGRGKFWLERVVEGKGYGWCMSVRCRDVDGGVMM